MENSCCLVERIIETVQELVPYNRYGERDQWRLIHDSAVCVLRHSDWDCDLGIVLERDEKVRVTIQCHYCLKKGDIVVVSLVRPQKQCSLILSVNRTLVNRVLVERQGYSEEKRGQYALEMEEIGDVLLDIDQYEDFIEVLHLWTEVSGSCGLETQVGQDAEDLSKSRERDQHSAERMNVDRSVRMSDVRMHVGYRCLECGYYEIVPNIESLTYV